MNNNKKIVSLKNLSKILINLKKNKKKIVLCHGVFDILHIGHIKHTQTQNNFFLIFFTNFPFDFKKEKIVFRFFFQV
jgi:bifunctional ADP-heptose synthase (sugar kinase/adenylyltransferase)